MGFRDGKYILRMFCSLYNSIYIYIYSVFFNIVIYIYFMKKDIDRFIKRIGFVLLILRIYFYLIYFCIVW